MKNVVYAKKRFGQNFLIDKNIINKIINLVGTYDYIVEIGPGRGALTLQLIKIAKSVYVYEIDPDMVNVLKENINTESLFIYQQDFLKVDLSNLPKSIIVANIPYYITTDILFKIFEHRDKFSKVILMVQKEVAQRIVANYKSKEYSKLSLSCQFLANVKIEFVVSASCFSPAPKVDSAIISLEFKDNIDNYTWNTYKEFFKLCFINRRKKLISALKSVYSMSDIQFAYNCLKMHENIRIQEIPIEQVILLYQYLNKRI
ncbi:16S rRNA (adenine(1518)-N(6)/adenine(1519)-N(6))-dimethyltransferase RsmA [Mycoplasma sp. 246B]